MINAQFRHPHKGMFLAEFESKNAISKVVPVNNDFAAIRECLVVAIHTILSRRVSRVIQTRIQSMSYSK